MKTFLNHMIGCVILLALFSLVTSAPTPPLTDSGQRDQIPARSVAKQGAKAQVVEAYGKLPLSFEANRGQSDPQVKFLARGKGYTLFLTPTEGILVLSDGTDGADENSAGPDKKSM